MYWRSAASHLFGVPPIRAWAQRRQIVEFYAELDQMNDEKLGYYEPRPWHRDKPQRLKVWKSDGGMIWGSPVPAGFM
jgi:hypothetical protein